MNKTIIAVDLDDVIVETAPGVIDHYAKKYGVKVPLEKFYSKDFKGVWGTPDGVTAVRRVNEFLESPEYYHSVPIIEATETIRWLRNKYELHIVTGRPSLVEEATRQWLERHFPDIFETVIFTNSYMSGDKEANIRSKGDVCLQLGATVLIDYNLEHALSAADAGLQVLLFGDYPWNRTDKLPSSVRRVQAWSEIREYFDAQG